MADLSQALNAAPYSNPSTCVQVDYNWKVLENIHGVLKCLCDNGYFTIPYTVNYSSISTSTTTFDIPSAWGDAETDSNAYLVSLNGTQIEPTVLTTDGIRGYTLNAAGSQIVLDSPVGLDANNPDHLSITMFKRLTFKEVLTNCNGSVSCGC